MKPKQKIIIYAALTAAACCGLLIYAAMQQNNYNEAITRQQFLNTKKDQFQFLLKTSRLAMQRLALKLQQDPNFADLIEKEDLTDAKKIIDQFTKDFDQIDHLSIFDFEGDHLLDGLIKLRRDSMQKNVSLVKACMRNGRCSLTEVINDNARILEIIPISPHGTVSFYLLLSTDIQKNIISHHTSKHLAVGYSFRGQKSYSANKTLDTFLKKVNDSKKIKTAINTIFFIEDQNHSQMRYIFKDLKPPKPLWQNLYFYVAFLPSLFILAATMILLNMVFHFVDKPRNMLNKIFINLHKDRHEKNPLQNADFDYATISDDLKSLIQLWQEKLNRAIAENEESRDKLERIADLAQIDDAEFNVFIAKINDITSDLFESIEDYRQDKIKEAIFFTELRKRSSIILNYANVFEIKKVMFAARKLLETISKIRGQTREEAADNIESGLYQIIFEMDRYMTIREIVLGKIIEDRGFLVVTQLKYQWLKTLEKTVSAQKSGTHIPELKEALHYMDMENIHDYTWRYNKHLRRISESQRKKISSIIVEGKAPLLNSKNMRILNDVILHSVEFLVMQCIDTAQKRKQRSLPEEAKITIRFVDSSPLCFTIEVDGTVINKGRLLREAAAAGRIQRKDMDTITESELGKLILLPLSQSYTVNNLSFVKEITDSVNGKISVGISRLKTEIGIIMPFRESAKDPELFPSRILWAIANPEIIQHHDLKNHLETQGFEITLDAKNLNLDNLNEAYTIIIDAAYIEKDTTTLDFINKQGHKIIFLASDFSKKEDQTYCKISNRPMVIPTFHSTNKIVSTLKNILANNSTTAPRASASS